jgi:hypothetical protein
VGFPVVNKNKKIIIINFYLLKNNNKRGRKTREALIYSIENKSVHTLMWFFAVFRRKTRKTIGQH